MAIVAVVAAGLIAGSPLAAARPITPDIVCGQLDNNPDGVTILMLMHAEQSSKGVSSEQAGEMIGGMIGDSCPKYLPVLTRTSSEIMSNLAKLEEQMGS